MRISKLLLPIFTLLLAWSFHSCEEEDSGPLIPPAIPTQLSSVFLPENIVLDSDYFHTFQVLLTGETFEGDVLCELKDTNNNSLALFSLHDDANAYVIENTPGFVSETSGDVVAGDGIYTRKLNAQFTNTEGEYTAIFKVLSFDATVNLTTDRVFNVYENQPPVLFPLDSTISDLLSDFEPFDLNIRVEDPQGREDIQEVKFELIKSGFSLNLEYIMNDPDLDSIFSYNMQPFFAAGLETGDYEFRFSAKDSLNEISYLPDLPVFIENSVPVLTDGAVDSGEVILIPDPGDTTEVVVTVVVDDAQTLIDIDSVYINYERPPHVPLESRWTLGYPMADNGLDWDLDLYLQGLPYLGDETPGDGIFTFTKLYTSTADTGLHKFHFHCVDLADNEADSITVELRIQ